LITDCLHQTKYQKIPPRTIQVGWGSLPTAEISPTPGGSRLGAGPVERRREKGEGFGRGIRSGWRAAAVGGAEACSPERAGGWWRGELRRTGREANRRERKEGRREQQVLELEGEGVVLSFVFVNAKAFVQTFFQAGCWKHRDCTYTSQNVQIYSILITTTTDLKLRI
jgi:hypothetical protein